MTKLANLSASRLKGLTRAIAAIGQPRHAAIRFLVNLPRRYWTLPASLSLPALLPCCSGLATGHLAYGNVADVSVPLCTKPAAILAEALQFCAGRPLPIPRLFQQSDFAKSRGTAGRSALTRLWTRAGRHGRLHAGRTWRWRPIGGERNRRHAAWAWSSRGELGCHDGRQIRFGCPRSRGDGTLSH
jgi:hypothetical protein